MCALINNTIRWVKLKKINWFFLIQEVKNINDRKIISFEKRIWNVNCTNGFCHSWWKRVWHENSFFSSNSWILQVPFVLYQMSVGVFCGGYIQNSTCCSALSMMEFRLRSCGKKKTSNVTGSYWTLNYSSVNVPNSTCFDSCSNHLAHVGLLNKRNTR